MFTKSLVAPFVAVAGFIGCTIVCAPSLSSATTFQVPGQHPTIQAALDVSTPGDTVLVAPGVYQDTVSRNVSQGGFSTFCANVPVGVVLRSEKGPESTEIHLPANDGPFSYALMVHGDGEIPLSLWTTIEGFTVTADSGTSGGSLFYAARIRLRDCRFEDLLASPPQFVSGGGAIASQYSEIDAESVIFEDCRATRGGAVDGIISNGYGLARFRDCSFRRCTGVAVRYSASSNDAISNAPVEFEDCVFEENIGGAVRYTSGGDFPWMNAYLVCRRCSFRSNTEGVLSSSGFRAIAIEDCEFVDNTSTSSSIIELHGSSEFEFNEPSSIAGNLFANNIAMKAIVDWNVAGGRFEKNFFTGGNGQEYSVAYLSPHRGGDNPPQIEVAGNLFEQNGPSPLFGIPQPEGVPATCNIVWQNSGGLPELPGFISIDPQLCEPASGSREVAASSPCLSSNASSICGDIGNVVVGCPSRGTISIGIASSPPGRQVFLDEVLHWTPSMFSGDPGDIIELGTTPIQMAGLGERYIWNSWNDGGEIEHSITLSQPEIYAADFGREFLLKSVAGAGGNTDPLEQWVDEGASASVSATPDAHYSFLSWAGSGPGSYSGPDNPATVVMNGPITETGSFQLNQYPVTMVAGSGGEVFPANAIFPAQSVVRIQAFPDQIHRFSAWIGTGPGSYTGTEPEVDIVIEGPIEQRAFFTPIAAGYTLTLSASDTDPGVTTSPPSNGWRRIYLWAACLDRGLSAFEAEVSTQLTSGGFEPQNGVLNAGSKSHLLLAIPGCPIGPNANVLLGSWNVFDSGGEICLLPSTETGNLAAVDCDTPNPHLWQEPVVEGFSSLSTDPCVTGSIGCGTVEMDPALQELPGTQFAPRDLGPSSDPAFSSIQPNPFTFETNLHFVLPQAGRVQISIYDVRGRLVKRLFQGSLRKGPHSMPWNGRDDSNRIVSPGVLFARLEAGEFAFVRKLLRVEERRNP